MEEKVNHVGVDRALALVGGYRRWNLLALFLLGISTYIPVCWQNLSIVFIGYEPPYHCLAPNGSIPLGHDGELSRCHIYSNISKSNRTELCNKWIYDDEGYNTIVTEFDLVCSNNYLSEVSQTIYQLGIVVEDLVWSYLADRFGRRAVHMTAHAWVLLFGIGAAFSHTYLAFVILRTVAGVFVSGAGQSGVLLMIELFDADHRAFAGIGLQFMWLFVYLWLPLLAAYITNWRFLQFIISCTSIVWIMYKWVLVESPAWLASYNQVSKAEANLKKMAKWNGLPDVQFSLASDTEVLQTPKLQQHILTNTVPVKELFVDTKLRLHLLLSCLLWFCNTTVYFGMILSTPSLGGNRFLNFFLMGIAELPAYAIAMLVIDRFGRRPTTFIFHVIAGICLIFIPFIPDTSASGTSLWWLVLVTALVAKFGITGSFAVVCLHTREVFPTNVRGSANGIYTTIGRVGSMTAPFMSYLAKHSFWLPSLVFGVVSGAAGCLVWMLPETARKPLPRNTDEMYHVFYHKVKVSNKHPNDVDKDHL